MDVNKTEALVFFVLSPLAVIIGYLVTFRNCKKITSRIFKENEYFFHILLLSKSILILAETADVAFF